MNYQIIRYELKTIYNYYPDIGICYVKNNNPDGSAHWHDCYELVLVYNGSADEIINDCHYKAKAGDMFFLTPNDFHQIDKMNGYACYTIMFPKDIINKSLLDILSTRDLKTNYNYHPDSEMLVYITSLFDLIGKELRERKANYKTTVINLINVIIAFVLRDGAREGMPASNRYITIRKAVAYIMENFANPLTLSEVAEQVNLNERYFSDLFCKKMGVNFKTFLNETRLSNAARYLHDSKLPITDICYMCGYGSLSNFNRMFKRHYGISPREYRRKLGANRE